MTYNHYDEKKFDAPPPPQDVEVVPLGYRTSHRPSIAQPLHDDVWGDMDGSGPNYRGLGWIRTSVVLIKIQIGLGVLVMPSVLHTLGMVPGVLVIVGVGILTTWTDYIVGTFKAAHPSVYTLADVGEIMWGRIGREVLFVAYWLYLVFIAAAGLLGASTAFNALSEHAICTAAFVFISAMIVGLVASIQTLDRISWITWVGVLGIFASLITLAVAVGLQDRPSALPEGEPWNGADTLLVGDSTLIEAMGAVSTVIFSYSGAPAFFSIVSEMRDARKYTRSLFVCQALVISCFTIIGVVVYHFCGIYVTSPALGSAGPLFKKICYGLALPGLLCGAILNTHIPAKLIFVRVFRNSKHLAKNTPTHVIAWLSLVFMNVSLSFLIAEAIPVFGNLLGLIGAILSTPLCMTVEGFMYIYETRRRGVRLSAVGWLLQAFNAFIIVGSVFATITGLWASVLAIRGDINKGNTTPPFSCADNSSS